MSWARKRLGGFRGEEGFTLIELLVAAAMSVVLIGAASTMVISAVQTQPELSKRSQDVSSARWILERMTREIRNGIVVDSASGSTVSFKAYVRHSECGGSALLPAGSSSIECEITYDCSTGTSCSRTEREPNVLSGGTARTVFTGIASDKVFNFSPNATEASFIGVTLRFPNPDGGGFLTISDGASLRTADVLN
jgi:prepilin-type N-terminal cleavage/methylation domain-containing protein